MELIVTVLLFVVGLALIIKGGDIFVDAATWAADISGIPKFIIGATVVSFATTLPELLVSLFAAFDGKVDIAIGNAVGSVTANTGMIMAFSMLFLPSVAKRKAVGLKLILLIVSIGTLFAFSLDGKINMVESCVLLVLFVANMAESIIKGKSSSKEKKLEEKVEVKSKDIAINVCKFIFGTAGIVIGADMLVDYGSKLALEIGVSEAVIGATMIAVGTSLPELVTTVTAIIKKEAALSIGNIIGANVIDLTLILPLCALLSGELITVAGQNLMLDVPACFFVVLVAAVPILIRQKYTRVLGCVVLATYAAYLYFVFSGNYPVPLA